MKLPVALNNLMSRVFSLFAFVDPILVEAEETTHVKPDNLETVLSQNIKTAGDSVSI